MSDRPSYRERDHKLRKARDCIAKGCWSVANPQKWTVCCDRLGLYGNEPNEALEQALNEISPNDYMGRRNYSREKTVADAEMFGFAWDSKHFGRRMYVKFVIHNDHMWVIDIHEDEPCKKTR